MKKLSIVLWFLLLGGMMMPLWGQAQEKLGRGVVAVKSSDGVFLSWRSLATDTRKFRYLPGWREDYGCSGSNHY